MGGPCQQGPWALQLATTDRSLALASAAGEPAFGSERELPVIQRPATRRSRAARSAIPARAGAPRPGSAQPTVVRVNPASWSGRKVVDALGSAYARSIVASASDGVP